MGKILFLLVILAFLFFYYSKPVSIEQPKPAEPKQEQVKKPVKPKTETKQKEQKIEVEETTVEKPLPSLSAIVQTTLNHPYADPDKYPLHYAICKEDFNKVKQVLRKESLANEQGEVIIGQRECYCPQNKYEVCLCDETLIMPPLNLAILKRNEAIAKYLLQKKANPLLRDSLGRNALDLAQQKNMANLQNLLAQYIK